VIVTEVYAAREKAEDFDHFSAAQAIPALQAALARTAAEETALFLPGLEDAGRYLLENLRPGDVLLVLSAGDADQISAKVLAALRERTKQDA
jgi:UDP-N-acetylmuramate--alanine ligase